MPDKEYLRFSIDFDDVEATLTPQTREFLNSLAENNSMAALDCIKDVIQELEFIYQKAYYQQFPRLRPPKHELVQ